MRITKNTIGPWTPTLIKAVLLTSQDQREKALIKIFNRQTQDEKIAETTKYHNDRGFTGADATILTSFANQLMTKKYLTEKQNFLLSKKIVKYSNQLCQDANLKWALENDSDPSLFNEDVKKLKIKSLRERYLQKYDTVIKDLITNKVKK